MGPLVFHPVQTVYASGVEVHLSYNLNSLQPGYIGKYIGDSDRAY